MCAHTLIMSEHKPTPPNFVPEEDLSMHENFAPIIAENGLIRQPQLPDEETILTASLTRIDTVQDLVEIRQAEKKEKTLPPQPVPQELESVSAEPLNPEHTFAITSEEKPTLNLTPSPLEGEEGHSSGAGETAQSTTTLPAVIPATTTALVTTQKPKRRKSSLFKKRKKSSKQEKPIKKLAKEQPPAIPPTTPAPTQSRKSWRWLLAVLILLFLGSITGVVPVEKIPLLRSVAYAMGLTKDDTSRMSFLRALLAWADKTVGLPGNWSADTGRTSLFARRSTVENSTGLETSGTDGLNARMTRYSGQTSLINMAALQKLQREKGRPQDGLRGAIMPAPGQAEAQAGPAQLIGDHVEVRTESTRVQGDVYFGSDAGAINRDTRDAYDSSKMLTKVKNPHIADGKPIDWLSSMAQKMIRATNSLAGVDRELNNTKVNWQSSVMDVGDNKEHKDLYHAWITSRMSKYTQNNMLKKALADSSFLGADIPTVVSNVLSFGGVQVDAENFSRDQKEWQEYLEWEKQCKEELSDRGASGRIDRSIEQYNNMFHSFNDQAELNLGFPLDCSPSGGVHDLNRRSAFEGRIHKITTLCDSVTSDYTVLGNKCLMQSFSGTCDKSIRTKYSDLWNGFVQHCHQKYVEEEQKWKDEWCQQNKAACEAGTPPPPYPAAKWEEDAKAYTQEKWHTRIEDEVLTETGAKSDYFSAVVRTEVDANGNVIYIRPGSQEHVTNTVVKGMQQNKTL